MSKPGDTAIMHARAWIAASYPDAPMQQAKKFVIRHRGRHISLGEDIFGVFDFLVLPRNGILQLVQVTTQGTPPSSTSDRKRKIKDWIKENYPGVITPLAHVLLMAWVKGKHFRRWEWSWAQGAWNETATVNSPLLKPRPSTVKGKSRARPGTPKPTSEK